MSPERKSQDLIDALAQLATQIQQALDRSAAEYAVSPPQARLLRALRGGGAPTISGLARQLALDKSSTSGLVDRAQRRGLVRRVPSQRDRRSVRVRLTADGGALAGDIATLAEEELEALVEPLTDPERDALTNLLSRLLRD